MIKYRSLRNWKYQLVRPYKVSTPLLNHAVDEQFYRLNKTGDLLIRKGYCWDGPSGPTWDSPSSLRPSLVHDVFYQMMRKRSVKLDYRKVVDDFFHTQLLEAGMDRFRAWYFWKAVRLFGKSAASSAEPENEVMTAP